MAKGQGSQCIAAATQADCTKLEVGPDGEPMLVMKPGYGLSRSAQKQLASANAGRRRRRLQLGAQGTGVLRRSLQGGGAPPPPPPAPPLHIAVFKCPDAKACPNNNTDGSGLPTCVEGHGGPLCAMCAEGFTRAGLDGPCGVCDGDAFPWLPVIFMLLAGCGFVLFVRRYLKGEDKEVQVQAVVVMANGKVKSLKQARPALH